MKPKTAVELKELCKKAADPAPNQKPSAGLPIFFQNSRATVIPKNVNVGWAAKRSALWSRGS
ncbi:hypothetical protein ACFLY8_05025 [Halobacteriota archaeon]